MKHGSNRLNGCGSRLVNKLGNLYDILVDNSAGLRKLDSALGNLVVEEELLGRKNCLVDVKHGSNRLNGCGSRLVNKHGSLYGILIDNSAGLRKLDSALGNLAVEEELLGRKHCLVDMKHGSNRLNGRGSRLVNKHGSSNFLVYCSLLGRNNDLLLGNFLVEEELLLGKNNVGNNSCFLGGNLRRLSFILKHSRGNVLVYCSLLGGNNDLLLGNFLVEDELLSGKNSLCNNHGLCNGCRSRLVNKLGLCNLLGDSSFCHGNNHGGLLCNEGCCNGICLGNNGLGNNNRLFLNGCRLILKQRCGNTLVNRSLGGRNEDGLLLVLEEICSRVCLRCNARHNGLGLNGCIGLLLVHKNCGRYGILVDRCADMNYTANVLGRNDGDGNILGNVSRKGICLGKYGLFSLRHLRCGRRSINESASLHAMLEDIILRTNVSVRNVVILRLINDVINRRSLGNNRRIDRRLAFDNQTVVLESGVRNILVHLVRKRLIDFIRIRNRAAVDRLHRIRVGLGNNDSVKAVNLRHRLRVHKNSCGGLESVKEYAVGCIPLGIIEILVKLNGSVVVLPLLNLLMLLNLEVDYDSTDEQGEESCNKAEEYVQHRIIPSAGLGRFPFREGGDHHGKERRKYHQRTEHGLLVFLKDVHKISIHCLFTAYPYGGNKKYGVNTRIYIYARKIFLYRYYYSTSLQQNQ